MSKIGLRTALLLGAVLAVAPAAAQKVDLDPGIQPYAAVSGISGNLSSVGSDTLNNLMTLWSEGFRKLYPSVRVQVEGKGSSTAPPALIEGTAQFGPMSRAMKNREADEFEARFGYPPVPMRVAVDALAVYVHKDNPLERLTLAEVDAIFSKNRRCGLAAGIDSWDQLGVGGALDGEPIRLYGRNSASGTYGYFKNVALCKGDFRDTTKEQPGSASVVQGVTEDLSGIGYSGIGYRTSGVRTLVLAAEEGGAYASTEPGDVYSGAYPLARFLYVYVNKPPNEKLEPLSEEFLRFVFSQAGQEIVLKDGYLPLPAAIADQELAKLD
ncbi:MAG: phosphate ABC transporter substrate-binding protein [Proteobacteria bacterium]|nr:phosphate ABC transporter substrate-binding protein [Pseudomonadota bacterium]